MIRLRALFGLTLAMTAPAALAQEMTELCKEAATRYRDLYGREAAAEPVKTVLMYKYRFCPENVTVKTGEKLRYINVDKRTSHSVWLRDAGQAESERVFSEGVVDVDTRLPNGEHQVLCGPHWQSDGMIGKIIVEK